MVADRLGFRPVFFGYITALWAGFCCAAVLLGGCGSILEDEELRAYLAPGVPVALTLSVPPVERETRQLMTITHAEQRHALICLTALHGGILHLSGLSIQGVRLFEADYDGSTLKTKLHLPLSGLPDPAQVLLDIMLCLWPVEQLQPILPAGYRLSTRPDRRVLYDDRGDILYDIAYTASGEISSLRQQRFGYSIDFQEL
ncbi:MAG: DUF3261 domain-containing protein [Succinivibrio sp.]|nr:DUF3261 domain-containing protein [Succinivibrio sp.]